MEMTSVTKNHTTPASLNKLSLDKRIECIHKLKRIVLRDREKIIDHILRETGKSRSDALMSEIFPTLDHLEFLIKNAKKALSPQTVKTPISLMGKKSQVFYDPIGTVLVISPWNYPFYQAVLPCSSSFLCGNTTWYKPSEHTPLQGLLEPLFEEAGITQVEIFYGDGKMAENLIEKKPRKIFFTGSTTTGKKIMAQAAKYLIPVELELGGKDPMIVFEDTTISRAAKGAVWGAFTNCGQSCTSVEVVYVQRNVYESFKKAVTDEVLRLKQWESTDPDCDIGSMTTDFQTSKVKAQIEEARKLGVSFLADGVHPESKKIIPPTVLDNPPENALVLTDETFGPVLPIIPFDSEEEVINLVNKSAFGLSASVWSKNLKRATRVAHSLETGNVSINNVMLTEGNHYLPFGGVKASGFGRSKGIIGLHGFTNIKSVLIDHDSKKVEANWYPYTKTKYKIFTNMMLGLFSNGPWSIVQFLINGLKLESYSSKNRREKTNWN